MQNAALRCGRVRRISGQNTVVLIAARDPKLVERIVRALPAIDARAIADELPGREFAGPVFCFIDWLLPDLSGLEMCRRLRDNLATRNSHITMVLDSPNPDDQRRALRAGADDYLAGPLDVARLAERIERHSAQAARAEPPPEPTPERLVSGGLSLDLSSHQARFGDTRLPLRPNEFSLLAHFMKHPDQVFGRDALIAALGKDGAGIDARTVDVWIGRLRRTLTAHHAPDPLRTVRAMGYAFDSLD